MFNNINKLLSLNEDFNFNDFSKKVSNKDIVRIIKENNKQNYIIEKFHKKVNSSEIFNLYIVPDIFPDISHSIEIQYKNKIYYAKEIDNLVFEPDEKIKINLKDDITDCSHLFYNCDFTYLDLSHFNTSNVTDMSYMFASCEYLEELDLSSFNTSKVTNMLYMFAHCEKLEKLNLSSFNTSNVTDMSGMFTDCTSLKSVKLNSFNTSNINNMNKMFANCKNLNSLDLSSFNTSNVTDMSYMFAYCEKLEKLDLSSFNTSNVTDMSGMTGMFTDCINLNINNVIL